MENVLFEASFHVVGYFQSIVYLKKKTKNTKLEIKLLGCKIKILLEIKIWNHFDTNLGISKPLGTIFTM